jgi:aldehyde dehydrogenase (NAD+)
LSPATGEPWATFAEAGAADVDAAVGAARRAFERGSPWSKTPASQRARILRRLADLVREESDHLAQMDSIDSGRIISDTSLIAPAVAATFEYFAGWCDKLDGRVVPSDRPGFFNYTLREPVGVVAAIIPWNNPLAMLAFKLAPALATGNTVVVKASEHSSGTTVELARLCGEAGFPPGVVNVLTGFAEPAQALTAHPGVDKISFTGSSATGRAVMRSASENLTQTMLELGGKAANIVFPDAHREQAVSGALTIFSGTGQACTAPSRLLLHESIYDTFLDELVDRAAKIEVGDPLEPSTQMGPVATLPQLERDEYFVRRGLDEGATLLLGGSRLRTPPYEHGWYFEPTILTDAGPHSYIAQEEAFGPILTVLKFEDEEEALAMANDVAYGLASGIWTTDLGRAHRFASELATGMVWINTWRTVSHASPFGGIKNSGYGRENGPEALLEMTTAKSVWVELTDDVADPFSWKK